MLVINTRKFMSKMHIHISVENLEESIKFYSSLFGSQPTKLKNDYAKWMLDDPSVNFAISARGAAVGIDHIGIQAENEDEMQVLRDRINAADIDTFDDGPAVCCYSKSDKSWIQDPSGIAWETYHTMDEANFFNEESQESSESACCVPEMKPKQDSCKPDTGCC